MVMCFGINPSNKGLPIYHITLLNLKAPVVSFDVTTILGREHHSAEEGEHVELSCFQEEASDQASIQQYHILSHCLAEFSKYGQQLPSISVPVVSSSPAPAVVSPVVSSLPPLSPYSNQEAPFAAESESSKAKNILSMLRNAASAAPASPQQSGVPASWSRDESDKSESKILSAISASNTPSPSPALVAKPTEVVASSPVPEGMKKIDSKLLFGMKSASPAPAPVEKTVATSNDLPDFLVAATAPKQTSISDMLRKSIGTMNGNTPLDTISSLLAPTPIPASVGLPAASSRPSNIVVSNAPPSLAPPPAAADLPAPKLVEMKKAPVPSTSHEKVSSVDSDVPVVSTTTAPILSVPVAPRHTSSETESQMMAMLVSIQADLKALQAANNKKEQPQGKSNELAAIKEEILKEVRAQQTKIATHTAQAVKSQIDTENKKILDALQLSKQEVRFSRIFIWFWMQYFSCISIFFSLLLT